MPDYLIIGGGIAGTTCAETLRKNDKSSSITIVTEDQHPVYTRVLLPNYIVGKTPRERLFLKKETWYDEKGIEYMRGLRVTSIDAKNHFVALSDGRELPYDKLIIATGGDARLLEGEPRGVSYMRTIEDSDHLITLMKEVTDDDGLGIYGGGFIATEYLKVFADRLKQVTIAFRGPFFWSRILDAASGEMINNHLRAKGMRVIPNASYDGVIGENVLEKVVLNGEEIPVSILGIGVGLEKDYSWLKEAGLDFDRGLLVNEFLETNLPDIYAAGDIAQYQDLILGRQLNVMTWMSAIMQGRHIANNFTGDKKPFEIVSSYAAGILGLETIFIADIERDAADEILVRGSEESGGVTQIFIRDNKIVGATIIGRIVDRVPTTKMIKDKVDVSGIKKDLIDIQISI